VRGEATIEGRQQRCLIAQLRAIPFRGAGQDVSPRVLTMAPLRFTRTVMARKRPSASCRVGR
jgi:hypothetical protein